MGADQQPPGPEPPGAEAAYAIRLIGMSRYAQPIALLARLGVNERHEGQGLVAALLLDAITRSPASAMPSVASASTST